MSNEGQGINEYGEVRASNYDEESVYDKGNRDLHKTFLYDVLTYHQKALPSTFLDLGCGTGYFTDVFFELYPTIHGDLIDGSEEMLKQAEPKFKNFNVRLHHVLFEEINWSKLKLSYDIVFSSLAIHHLRDLDKWRLFQEVYNRLSENGIFILYDIFKPTDLKSFELLEFLACQDVRRRLKADLELDTDIEELNINNIIANDRRIKAAEGDKETCLELQKENLLKVGFNRVTTIFQDARFAGSIAFKR